MSDGGMSGGEAAGVITATGGVLVIMGKGWAWLNKQRKGRIGQLEADVKDLRQAARQQDCVVGVCCLLVDDIRQHRPDAPVLRQVHTLAADFPELLRRLFPPEPVPDDMLETVLKAKRKGE